MTALIRLLLQLWITINQQYLSQHHSHPQQEELRQMELRRQEELKQKEEIRRQEEVQRRLEEQMRWQRQQVRYVGYMNPAHD